MAATAGSRRASGRRGEVAPGQPRWTVLVFMGTHTVEDNVSLEAAAVGDLADALRALEARGLRVIVVARIHGHRHRLARVRVNSDGTFSLRPRVRAARGARFVRVHAVVRGVGRSRSIRVRLR